MVSTDQSLGMKTKQTQVFNQYKKEQTPPPLKVHINFVGHTCNFCVDLKLSK